MSTVPETERTDGPCASSNCPRRKATTMCNVPETEHPDGRCASFNCPRKCKATRSRYPHVDINMFALALADYHPVLQMEKMELEEGVYEIPRIQLDQPYLVCPNCMETVQNTSELVKHLVQIHKPQEQVLFERVGLVSRETNEVLVKTIDEQMEKSLMKIKIENSDHYLTCPLQSPLFPILGLHHLRVYLDELPYIRAAKPRIIRMELKRPERTYTLFFSWVLIDRAQRSIKKKLDAKREKHLARYYEELCDHSIKPETDDVILKKTRTEEENECLAIAYNLPKDFTQEQLLTMVGYKPNIPIPETVLSYNAVEDHEGNALNKEQRKLISTLSNKSTLATTSKRRVMKRVKFE